MGPQHNTGVSHRLPKRTIPTLHAIYTTLYSKNEPANPQVGKRTPTKRSSVCDNNSTDKPLFQPISSPKKGRRSEASHQSKSLKPVCPETTFQDRRDPQFTRDHETEQLDGQSGPEGCLLHNTNPQHSNSTSGSGLRDYIISSTGSPLVSCRLHESLTKTLKPAIALLRKMGM